MLITELLQSEKNGEEDRSYYESQDIVEDEDEDIDLHAYEQERDSMRNELSGYLASLRELSGSDGKSLLSIPSNVDSVSAAMNRGDLTSNVQNPWSKYLLDSQFEDDMNVEFQGRYHGLSNTETMGDQKIMRGLAEIHLLDNQLSALTKKQIRIRNGALSEVGDDEASRAMSARSTMSKADGTFLTRIKQSMHGSQEDYNHLNTSKEDDEEDEDDFEDDDLIEGLTEGSPTIKSKESKTRMKMATEDKDGGGGGAISARTGGSASEAPPKRPLSAQLIRVSGLSQRDDIKLRMLLDEEDDDVEPFGGLHEEDRKRLADIDRELEEYKLSDPLFSSRAKLLPPAGLPVHPGITAIITEERDKDKDPSGGSPSPTRQQSKAKAPKGDPIIAEQRALREHKNYVDDLDRKLARVRSMDIDYSGLLVDDATAEAAGEDAIAGPSDDRSVGVGVLERRISMRDIRHVLDTLLGSLQGDGGDDEEGLDSDYDEMMQDKVKGSPTTTDNNNHGSPSSSRVPLSSHRSSSGQGGMRSKAGTDSSSSNNNTPSPSHKFPSSPSQDDAITLSSSHHHHSRPATGTTAYSSTAYTDSTSPTDSVKKSMRRRKDRAGIDRLLSDHRSEIVRLGFLRHNRRLKSMVAQSNSSGGSLALNTARSEITTASATAAALAAMGNFDELDEQYDYDEQEGAWTGSPNGKRTYKRSPETARSSVHGTGNQHHHPQPAAVATDPVDEVAAFLQARIREKHQDHGGTTSRQQQPVIMFGNGQGHIGRSASVGVVTSRNNNNNEPADKEKIKQALKRLKKFPRGSSGDDDVVLPDDVALDEHEEKGYTVFPPITQQRRPQSGSKTFQGTNSSSYGGDSGYGYEEMGDSGGDALGRGGRDQRQQRHDEEEEDEVQEEEEEETTWQLRGMLKQRRQNQGNDQPPASTLTL